ncbi:TetR/AcrR family transcriptional regulator, partial [Frankia sp. CcWB3]
MAGNPGGAGIEVARTEGISGLSMSRVAAEPGAATMSLYRYISVKDELLMLMADAAMGRPPGLSISGWNASSTGSRPSSRASARTFLVPGDVPDAMRSSGRMVDSYPCPSS